MKRPALALVTAATIALSLTACSSDNADTDAAATTAAETTAAATSAAEESTEASASTSSAMKDEKMGEGEVHLHDGTMRAKAAADAEGGSTMTAIFGVLENHRDEDVTLIGFTTSLGDATYEIHEVVNGVMQEKPDGITIPAGGQVELKPGGEHLMIMGYEPEVAAGETVDVTLLLSDGTTAEVKDVAVRTMLPGDEDYGDLGHGEHGGMDHSEHKH